MITYVATTGTNKAISSCPAYLERIIVGKDVASSVVKVSNSPDSGSEDVKVYLEGSALLGVYEVGTEFNKGICADLTSQTNVAFVWYPISA